MSVAPHLLAKETTGNCYDWYKQNKKTLQLEKIDFQNNSWLKIKDTIDFRYVAISYNCKDTCESVVISQLTDKSNFIRCGNGSEQSVTIFPMPEGEIIENVPPFGVALSVIEVPSQNSSTLLKVIVGGLGSIRSIC